MAPLVGGILFLLIACLVFASPSPLRRSRRTRRAAADSSIDGDDVGYTGDSYFDAGFDCGGGGDGGD